MQPDATENVFVFWTQLSPQSNVVHDSSGSHLGV
jgi:hypothetical protein